MKTIFSARKKKNHILKNQSIIKFALLSIKHCFNTLNKMLTHASRTNQLSNKHIAYLRFLLNRFIISKRFLKQETLKILLEPRFLTLNFTKVRIFYAENSLKSMEKFIQISVCNSSQFWNHTVKLLRLYSFLFQVIEKNRMLHVNQ